MVITKKSTRIVEYPQEQIEENLELLSKSIKSIEEIMKILNVPQQILERPITEFGNSSHIILPKEYAGKTAKVIIKK
jgi:putative transposon-encoded protein